MPMTIREQIELGLQRENIFTAGLNLCNGKLDEICVMILGLNVFGTLTQNILLPI